MDADGNPGGHTVRLVTPKPVAPSGRPSVFHGTEYICESDFSSILAVTHRMGIATKPLSALPDTEQSFSEMLDRHKRNIGVVVLAALVGVGGYWFYAQAKAKKEVNATAAFHRAMQSVAAGNAALATSDLRTVAQRYDGTLSGTEAVIELAQLQYNDGKYQDGINVLKKANPVPDLAYDVKSLIGAGYEGLNQGAQAAKSYEDAAQAARFPADRDMARSNAARAYLSAGNNAEASKIWSELANDPKSVLAPEARVRLGEAEAKPVKP